MRRINRTRYVWCAVISFVLLGGGCSQVTRDKLLRVFIDGAPESNKEESSAVGQSDPEKSVKERKAEVIQTPKPGLFYHEPFLEQMCDSCHDSKFSQKLVFEGKELCFTCHDDFTKDKKVVHYPADEGLCVECHSPHQSGNKKLLKNPVPAICYTCHDDFAKGKKVVHYPVGEGLCLECHDPHSSENAGVLKKAVPGICFTCHDERDVKAQPQHEGQDMCLECHDPHASNAEKLLK